MSRPPSTATPTLLQTDALTPDGFEGIFQPIIVNILGVTTDAWSAVRLGWQQTGQPAWGIDEDVCILTAKPLNDEFSQVRDELNTQNNSVSVNQEMSLTQVWSLHVTVYGPNSYAHARLIVSSMVLDSVHDALAADGIYAITQWNSPTYNPENFQGQWWLRADVNLSFNEFIQESVVVPSAESVAVEVITDTNVTESFTISGS